MNKPPYFGVAYYPETWDEDLVDVEIQRMLNLGINLVRIGEFAWKKDEPEEGKYSFEWLHRVVDKLEEAGISVVMGTPTAAPPIWLVKKYPDMLVQRPDGSRRSHGHRRHCCSSNPHYMEYSAKIVEQLGKEFGNQKNIVGWQIDNEIYNLGVGCCCEHCVENFRKHLKNKFGTIEELNKAWNLNIFSIEYESFDDIPAIPQDDGHNPHIVMEWRISQQNNHIEFVHMQADILRKYTKASLGTDIMPQNGMNFRKMFEKLDVVMFNHYNSPDGINSAAMWMDYFKNFSKRPFWVSETEACWNGSTSAEQSVHPDGYIYMNTWLPMALGGEANSYWHWRAHWAGPELMHGAVLDADGRPTYAYNEIKQAISEIKQASDFINNTKVYSDVAFQYTSLSWSMQESQKFVMGLDYNMSTIEDFYTPIVRCGLHADLIDSYASLDQYRLIFSPMVFTLEEGDFVNRIEKWVKDGGTWVVGPLTDIRTANGTRYKNSPYGMLEKLTGQRLAYYIPDNIGNVFCKWEKDGEDFCGDKAYEVFEDDENADILVRVVEGHKSIKGKPCVISCKVGKGTVILLGTFPDGSGMKKIIAEAANCADIKLGNTEGDSLMVVDRCGEECRGTIVLDLFGKGGNYRFGGKRKDLITGKNYVNKVTLKPYQVMVLENINE